MVRDSRPDKTLARQIQKRDGIPYTAALRKARDILAKLEEVKKEEEQ